MPDWDNSLQNAMLLKMFKYERDSELARVDYMVNSFFALLGASSKEAAQEKINVLDKLRSAFTDVLYGESLNPDYDPKRKEKKQAEQDLEILEKVGRL